MIGFEEQEKVRALLREAVTVLCRNGLPGCGDLSVEGLLGITLENREVFLVKIDERITQDGSSGGSPDTELVAGVSPTPTSNSTRQRKRNRDTTSANAGLSQKSSDEPYNKKVRDSGGGGDDGRVAAEDSDDSENETEKQENEKDNENREQDNNSPMVTASTTTAATPQKVKTETTNETGSDVTSESNSADVLDGPSDAGPITVETDAGEITLEPGSFRAESATFSPEKSLLVAPSGALAGAEIGNMGLDWCPYCGKTFPNQTMLSEHTCVQDDRWYQCQICGKQLGTKEGLRRHMNKHTGNFKHKCTMCEKGFNRPYELKRHMNQKHHQRAKGGTQAEGANSKEKDD